MLKLVLTQIYHRRDSLYQRCGELHCILEVRFCARSFLWPVCNSPIQVRSHGSKLKHSLFRYTAGFAPCPQILPADSPYTQSGRTARSHRQQCGGLKFGAFLYSLIILGTVSLMTCEFDTIVFTPTLVDEALLAGQCNRKFTQKVWSTQRPAIRRRQALQSEMKKKNETTTETVGWNSQCFSKCHIVWNSGESN
jgi:hypothetical protein